MMRDAINNFPKQFAWEPEIKNADRLPKKDALVVAGMGGSQWSMEFLKMRFPGLPFIAHRDYGLPELPAFLAEHALVVASSYSGETEETISACDEARMRQFPLAVIAKGGKLLELARAHTIPYVELPDTGIQPRMATGLLVRALLKLLGKEEELAETSRLADILKPLEYEEQGKALAEKLRGFVPLIYASVKNAPITYAWKIKFNETGKIPAFANVFPELNHNEMTSFDWVEKNKPLSERFRFVFLEDSSDHEKIKKRMAACKELFHEHNFFVETVRLEGETPFEKIFRSLLLADWASLYTAEGYGAEPEQVPLVEEFKKWIA